MRSIFISEGWLHIVLAIRTEHIFVTIHAFYKIVIDLLFLCRGYVVWNKIILK